MITEGIQFLLITAAAAGFIHTILGPDHYLPFILIGKAREWNLSKILVLTFICGLGHILSSVLLGMIGIFMGVGIEKLNFIESTRGNLAAWGLIAFGFVYAIWGLRKALKNKKHSHYHAHKEGVVHTHTHNHTTSHLHMHKGNEKKITPWVLFIIFVLGPCEVLIPLLMYPAAQESTLGMMLVTLVFGSSTLLTMLTVVLMVSYGFSFVSMRAFSMYTHFIAGIMVFCSGLAIQLLGI